MPSFGRLRSPLRSSGVIRLAAPLERKVRRATDGNRQPEVDKPIGQHRENCGLVRNAEPHDGRNQDSFNHAEAGGSDRDDGKNVGQTKRHQKVNWRKGVTKGVDEDPEAGGIE